MERNLPILCTGRLFFYALKSQDKISAKETGRTGYKYANRNEKRLNVFFHSSEMHIQLVQMLQ